jgi:hypothetical protein
MTDVVNWQGVGTRAGQVVVPRHRLSMAPWEAMVHAAWLVTIAEVLDPDLDFEAIREAVRST